MPEAEIRERRQPPTRKWHGEDREEQGGEDDHRLLPFRLFVRPDLSRRAGQPIRPLPGHWAPAYANKEVTMKVRYYRIIGSLSVLSMLSAILAAPKKWG
jgi:hypothetical protein